MSQITAVRLDTNVDAEPGRDQLELVDRSRRPAGARGGRRGAPGAAGARLDAARRADRQPRRVEGRRVGRRRAEAARSNYGELLGDKPFNVKFTGTAPQKPIEPLQARRHARAARRHPGQGRPANTSTCSTCACPACCTAASCGRAASAPTAPAPSRLSIDESSISDIPGRARRAQGRFRRRRRRARMGRGQGRARSSR